MTSKIVEKTLSKLEHGCVAVSKRVGRVELACVVLALLCVGCGKETPAAAASAPPSQPSAPPSAPAAAAPVPAAPASALATSDDEKGTARAEVTELKRISGDMLMLRMGIVNKGSATRSMGFQYTDPHTGDINSVSGVTLVDVVNKKKYFAVRDNANHCLCSEGLNDLKPGERMNVWVRFPAPPEDVQKISLMIPHFPPIDDVTIGR